MGLLALFAAVTFAITSTSLFAYPVLFPSTVALGVLPYWAGGVTFGLVSYIAFIRAVREVQIETAEELRLGTDDEAKRIELHQSLAEPMLKEGFRFTPRVILLIVLLCIVGILPSLAIFVEKKIVALLFELPIAVLAGLFSGFFMRNRRGVILTVFSQKMLMMLIVVGFLIIPLVFGVAILVLGKS